MRVKWFLQYFGAPLLAAVVALYGNYLFVQKPLLNKEYTKIGLDLMLNSEAPESIRKFGQELLNQNSPLKLSPSEKEDKLSQLLKNVPKPVLPESTLTNGDLFAGFIALASWVKEVEALCESCVNEKVFLEKFNVEKKNLLDMENQSK